MNQACTRVLAILAASAIVAGCEGVMGTKDDDTQEAEIIEQSMEPEGTTTAMEPQAGWQGHPLDDPDPSNLLSTRIVYFDFDGSDVRPSDRAVLEAHAQYLSAHSSAQISLEGHADERGTREYNLALGERRSNAVRNIVTLRGGSGQQVRTISYGEERPVDPSHSEAAWAQNRRVEIVYLAR